MSMVPRPRQNRVMPDGSIVATTLRCGLMGNRGDLHAPDGTLGPLRWRSRAWISCRLDGCGQGARFDTAGHYYPLFLYDEAVAVAAGHRPCGQCRPDALHRFKEAWKRAHNLPSTYRLSCPEIDAELHRHRTRRTVNKMVAVDLLPNGTFIFVGGGFALLREGRMFPWTRQGYADPISFNVEWARPATPLPVIQAIRSGYRV